MTLAGLLEIADREFQALEDEDVRLRKEARSAVAEGRLQDVEITPDALKSYLDRKLGPDGRMTDGSYAWMARALRTLGFVSLKQVDEALHPYDVDNLSRRMHGTLQGQLTRLEDALLAAMGKNWINGHPFGRDTESWWRDWQDRKLRLIQRLGVEVGDYSPRAYAPSSTRS